jgi:predicted Zn-dependent peptidase
MTIHRTEYTSGLRVVTERMPGVRSVSLGVWVLAGSRDEAPAISGSSHFLEHLLFKGTKIRSAQDIAQAFDAVGGDLNAFTAKEYTCYYARVLDRDLELAVDHLADMLQHSVIRSADLDGERQVILEEINMHEDSPEDLVHDVFTETLWPDHPLGRPVLGTVATIEAATRASVRRFYKRHYVPGNFVVAAAGNVRHSPFPREMPPPGTSDKEVIRPPRRAGAWSADARPSRHISAWGPTALRAPIRTGSRSSW